MSGQYSKTTEHPSLTAQMCTFPLCVLSAHRSAGVDDVDQVVPRDVGLAPLPNSIIVLRRWSEKGEYRQPLVDYGDY